MQNLRSKLSGICALIFISTFSHTEVYSYSPDEPRRPVKDEVRVHPFLPNRDNNKELNEWMMAGAKLYKDLDNSVSVTPLKIEVFIQAYLGMVNLKNAQILDERSHILTITDYSLSSNVPRLWIIDLKDKKILYNTLVSHGQGSGEEYAMNFSNKENSHQTSLGFFLTDTTYYGRNGYSLRLHGLDIGYNNNALERAIVIHGAPYVSETFIQENQRLGRSWGCPALPEYLNREIIDLIKEGTLFFAYYPDHKYILSSTWLNKIPVESLRKLSPDMSPVMHAQYTADSVYQSVPVSNTL